MPPRLNVLSFARSIPYRPRTQPQWLARPVTRVLQSQCRAYSDAKDPPAADRSNRIESQPMPHVSEEAAKTAEIMGEQGPDLQKGTPVEEVVKGDKEAQDKLPQVMQNAIKAKAANAGPKGSRSYSTLTTFSASGDELDLGLVDFNPPTTAPAIPGLKFQEVALPLPKDGHVKHRYDPVVEQVTNLLMRHGKKSVAQKNMSQILQYLRTSPVPKVNPQRPLIPGAPPPSHLPLNPILYLTLAIDSVAPLMRIRSQRGGAGGGVALQIPVPLGQRQRRRTSIQWILTAAERRRNGHGGIAKKVADEVIAVVEGRSGVWDRRGGVHKLGVSVRANVVLPRKR